MQSLDPQHLPSLQAVTSKPPVDRFCDLVMKGGVTSGIAYPPAICELARKYHFKNIGGTSAGAIAASVAAAAEYQRRRTGSDAGFKLLENLPAELSSSSDGQQRLLSLFQPDAQCERPFRVLVSGLNRDSTASRVGHLVLGQLRAYWIAPVLSVALAIGIGVVDSLLAASLTFIICLLFASIALLSMDLIGGMAKNGYGLCKGLKTSYGRGADSLTPWLHRQIQVAAGRTTDCAPLTFGDLWSAPGSPKELLGLPGKIRSIDLQMFTTNLSHGRPYLLPHTDERARLFYNSAELSQYLPNELLTWLDDHAQAYRRSEESPDSDPDPAIAEQLQLKELPIAEEFPILLAARLSLSFPFLVAPIPLWAVDYDPPRGKRTFKRCIFSDGGLCSNFPMHLFDGLSPMWPTFGIQLQDQLADRPGSRVFLPASYAQGQGEFWQRFDERSGAIAKMFGFVSSIISTMQNWNDNVQARTPGVRDRVARLRLLPGQGGLNLGMPKPTIDDLVRQGGLAGQVLWENFAPDHPGLNSWDRQRWVRLDVLIHTLQTQLPGLGNALRASIPQATSYADLIRTFSSVSPPGHALPLTDSQAAALASLCQALLEVSQQFAQDPPQYSFTPYPPATLRVRAPL